MEQAEKDYQKVVELSKHAKMLEGISHLLEWDQETYMPPGAAAIRGEQLKTLAGLIHKEHTSAPFTHALEKLIDVKEGKILVSGLSDDKQAALKEWRRDYIHNTALPTKFVEEFAQLTSQSMHAWRAAKKDRSFLQFAPFLDKIIMMSRKKADLLGYKDHPYDALLNIYEPDVTTKEVEKVFGNLAKVIVPLLKQISSKQVDNKFLSGEWDHSKQMTFAHKILDAMGYNMHNGRVDFSSHPFSSASHPTDSRITTRMHPDSLVSNIFVILHEAGHALYEMGLPVEQYGTPLGEARSLGIHESQSKWWETRIGMTKPFWEHFYPILKETFHKELQHINLDQFHKGINVVTPSFIRVEADEVTYPLHVILRFELEKGLIDGSINVRDIPEIWNEKMEKYLGIRPQHHAEGCLQDIHWSMGAFGYFPTYALGNLYAAHLFEAFEKDQPQWEDKVAKGELLFIKEWLHDKIYRHGRRFPTMQLLKEATGKEFSADAYVKYIETKYLKQL